MVLADVNWGVPTFFRLQNLIKDAFARLDYLLLLLLFALSCIGLIVLYSAAGQNIELVWRQGWRLMIGFIFLVVFALVPLVVYRRWAWLLYIAGLVLLVFVLVAGEASKGAQRCLVYGC